MIPEHFKANGYKTACAGKVMHHTPGFNPPEMWDELLTQFFDLGYHTGADASAPPSGMPMKWRDGFPKNELEAVRNWDKSLNGTHEFDWGVQDIPDEETADAKAFVWAEEFLGRSHDKPFFLAVGSFRPHLPMYVPKKYLDLYPDDELIEPKCFEEALENIPEAGRELASRNSANYEQLKENGRYREFVRYYLASLSYADAQVGRVLDALAKSAYSENTYVVFWVDHGFHLGEKGHLHKSTLWEESTRIPLIVAGPGVSQTGVETTRSVSSLDLYPTLIDLCGLPAKPELDGMSLLPFLSDPQATRETPVITSHSEGDHAVRSEHWRYIRYADGSEELYDHRNDPDEIKNLAGKPEYAEIQKELAHWIPSTPAAPVAHKDNFDFDPVSYTWKLKA